MYELTPMTCCFNRYDDWSGIKCLEDSRRGLLW